MDLFRYKWVVPTLAQMHPMGGAKFITLIKRYGMSRSVLSTTLGHMIKFGLVQKNPGYGHPLRPEYVLTSLGAKVSPFCFEFVNLLEKEKMSALLQNRWACPIIFQTGELEMRFNEYKRLLRPITPKALSEGLNFLIHHDSMEKRLVDMGPPTSIYTLPNKIVDLCGPYYEYEEKLLLLG